MKEIIQVHVFVIQYLREDSCLRNYHQPKSVVNIFWDTIYSEPEKCTIMCIQSGFAILQIGI